MSGARVHMPVHLKAGGAAAVHARARIHMLHLLNKNNCCCSVCQMMLKEQLVTYFIKGLCRCT